MSFGTLTGNVLTISNSEELTNFVQHFLGESHVCTSSTIYINFIPDQKRVSWFMNLLRDRTSSVTQVIWQNKTQSLDSESEVIFDSILARNQNGAYEKQRQRALVLMRSLEEIQAKISSSSGSSPSASTTVQSTTDAFYAHIKEFEGIKYDAIPTFPSYEYILSTYEDVAKKLIEFATKIIPHIVSQVSRDGISQRILNLLEKVSSNLSDLPQSIQEASNNFWDVCTKPIVAQQSSTLPAPLSGSPLAGSISTSPSSSPQANSSNRLILGSLSSKPIQPTQAQRVWTLSDVIRSYFPLVLKGSPAQRRQNLMEDFDISEGSEEYHSAESSDSNLSNIIVNKLNNGFVPLSKRGGANSTPPPSAPLASSEHSSDEPIPVWPQPFNPGGIGPSAPVHQEQKPPQAASPIPSGKEEETQSRNYVREISESESLSGIKKIVDEGLQYARDSLEGDKLKELKPKLILGYFTRATELFKRAIEIELVGKSIDTGITWEDFSGYCNNFFFYRNILATYPSAPLFNVDRAFCEKFSSYIKLKSSASHVDDIKAILKDIRKYRLEGHEQYFPRPVQPVGASSPLSPVSPPLAASQEVKPASPGIFSSFSKLFQSSPSTSQAKPATSLVDVVRSSLAESSSSKPEPVASAAPLPPVPMPLSVPTNPSPVSQPSLATSAFFPQASQQSAVLPLPSVPQTTFPNAQTKHVLVTGVSSQMGGTMFMPVKKRLEQLGAEYNIQFHFYFSKSGGLDIDEALIDSLNEEAQQISHYHELAVLHSKAARVGDEHECLTAVRDRCSKGNFVNNVYDSIGGKTTDVTLIELSAGKNIAGNNDTFPTLRHRVWIKSEEGREVAVLEDSATSKLKTMMDVFMKPKPDLSSGPSSAPRPR